MSNIRPEGGRQISALLTPAAWDIFAQNAAGRRGGHFLSKCIIYWGTHGPSVKDGAFMQRDALEHRVKQLGRLIEQYIESRKQVESELEQVKAELARLIAQQDAETEQDSNDC